MWPTVIMCVSACVVAVGSVFLYEFEISEPGATEGREPATTAPAEAISARQNGLMARLAGPPPAVDRAFPDDRSRRAEMSPPPWPNVPPLRAAEYATGDAIDLAIHAGTQDADAAPTAPAECVATDYRELLLPLPMGDLRENSNVDLIRQARLLEAELRGSERRYNNQQLASPRDRFGKLQHDKEAEFRRDFLPRATSLAGELLLRLGHVDIPPHVASVSIKLGAAILASGELAGPNPMSPVADFLIFLARRLPP